MLLPRFWGGMWASLAPSRGAAGGLWPGGTAPPLSSRGAQDALAAGGLCCLVRCVPAFMGGFELPVRALNYVLEILFIFFAHFLFAVMSARLFV